MKRLALLLALVVCSVSSSWAQNKNCYVYGVDFSHAKVYAAEESVQDFARAFEAINLLLVTESSKYNFNTFCGCSVTLVLDPMMRHISSTDFSNLKTYQKNSPEIDYAKCIKEYVLPQKEGVGLVLIAKFLDKLEDTAYYDLVLFDIATREVELQKLVFGKAGGFGLRNYWAGSIHDILNTYRIADDTAVKSPASSLNKEQRKVLKSQQNANDVKKGYYSEVSLAYSYLSSWESFSQINLNYIGGYRFNHHIVIGLGTGLDFAVGNSYKPLVTLGKDSVYEADYIKYGDRLSDGYTSSLGKKPESRWGQLPVQTLAVPLYAHFRAIILKTKWSPFVAFSAGVRLSSPKQLDIYRADNALIVKNYIQTCQYGLATGMFELMAGVCYHNSKDVGFNLQIGYAARGGHCWTYSNLYSGTDEHHIENDWYQGLTLRLGVTF